MRVFESLESLRVEQAHLVAEAVDCVGVEADDACLMLRQHGWDPAEFNEAYFENPKSERKRAGASDGGGLPRNLSSTGVCAICFCDDGTAVLPCEGRLLKSGAQQHEHPFYCGACWRQYLGNSVREGKSCLDVRCPTPGCGEAVRPGQVEALLGDGFLQERYQRFWAESLVDDSRGHRRWCPGQGCGRAAEEPAEGAREVDCPCGVAWCFGCGTDAHLPVSCETVRQWEAKNRDESEDATWIRVNTKVCPKCSIPIEKNGGCMHMTCMKLGGCGHEFCWICLKDWKTHGACNAEPKAEAHENELRTELMRYMHTFERYQAHHKAQIFAATEQVRSMQMVASVLCSCHGLDVNEVEFLTSAVREIAASRRFLKWTYAHSFASKFDDNQRTFFDFHQAQLEGMLERLSDFAENTSWDSLADPDVESLRPFYDFRAELIGLTDIVHKLFSNLCDAIEQNTLFASPS